MARVGEGRLNRFFDLAFFFDISCMIGYRSLAILLAVCYSATLILGSCGSKPMFEDIDPERTGVRFDNRLTRPDSGIYNTGGIGIGDFDGDGLQDLYFTGHAVGNKLYMNRGNFHFQDVTGMSEVGGEGRLCRGVSIVDINNDGKPDIFVCASLSHDPAHSVNLLYVNQGPDLRGVPHFLESAKEFGLGDTLFTTNAQFFDYDNDGDLDVYLGPGHLYKAEWNAVLHHPVYHDVSKEAGIGADSIGLHATIADIDRDGWKDIYINDDIVYINNHDGTFSNKAAVYFKRSSSTVIGQDADDLNQDVDDLNNDGLADVIGLRAGPGGCNALFLNTGFAAGSAGGPIFSGTCWDSSIGEVGWNRALLVADLDMDGFRDLLVPGGYFRGKDSQVKLQDIGFRNDGNARFTEVSTQWGLRSPGFSGYSNGVAYVDLDNDGDLDLVMNVADGRARMYKNLVRERDGRHYLRVKLTGDTLNIDGLGVFVELRYGNGRRQVYENDPYRGNLQSVQTGAYFGLGDVKMVDSVLVKWPNGRMQVMLNVACDQVIGADKRNATVAYGRP